jgi:LacI family transcriptional regulator
VEKQKLTIDRIAKLAYVSRSVVSRVLNNRPNVSDEARARVMKVIKEYDYTPNATARSLATDRTNEISILAPRKDDEVFANGFWSLLFLGISEQSLRRNYFVSLSMVTLEMEAELNDRILYGHNFDGYILITREVAGIVFPAICRTDKPAVLIGHDPDYPDLNTVDVDNFDGAYQATRHLLDLGYRCIAAIMGNLEAQETRDRLAGYKSAHEEFGVPVSEDRILVGDFSQRSGYALMQQVLHDPLPARSRLARAPVGRHQ